MVSLAQVFHFERTWYLVTHVPRLLNDALQLGRTGGPGRVARQPAPQGMGRRRPTTALHAAGLMDNCPCRWRPDSFPTSLSTSERETGDARASATRHHSH